MAPKPRKAVSTLAPLDGMEPMPSVKPEPSTVTKCRSLFRELHEQKLGIKPFEKFGRDGKHFKDLAASYGEEQVLELIRRFFDTSDPKVVASDYSVAALYRLAQHVMLLDRRSGPRDRRTAENVDAVARATRRRN